jgi:hypothetical protein
MIIFHSIIFYVKYQRSTKETAYLYSYIFLNILFVVGPTVLINYFKHSPTNNEIENIGQNEE